MSIEPIDVTVGSETCEALLNTPEGEATDDGVVMISGAGHGPFGDIFDIVAYELAGAGRHVVRVETWESRDELDDKTLSELHAEVDAAVGRLLEEGCSSVSVIAKSFGGGIALTHVPESVERMLLWAPAVEFGAENDPDERMGDSDGMIGVGNVDSVNVPLRILVGDEDRGVSVEDCQEIATAVHDGDVVEIPGENHSFNQNRTAIVEETLAYLAPET